MDHIEELKREKENQEKLLSVLEKQEETVKIRKAGLKRLIKLIDAQIEELSKVQ